MPKLVKKTSEEDIGTLLLIEDLNDFQILKNVKKAQESARERIRELFKTEG